MDESPTPLLYNSCPCSFLLDMFLRQRSTNRMYQPNDACRREGSIYSCLRLVTWELHIPPKNLLSDINVRSTRRAIPSIMTSNRASTSRPSSLYQPFCFPKHANSIRATSFIDFAYRQCIARDSTLITHYTSQKKKPKGDRRVLGRLLWTKSDCLLCLLPAEYLSNSMLPLLLTSCLQLFNSVEEPREARMLWPTGRPYRNAPPRTPPLSQHASSYATPIARRLLVCHPHRKLLLVCHPYCNAPPRMPPLSQHA